MGNYQTAGLGLKKISIACMGAIACSLLALIPVSLINLFAALGAIAFWVVSGIGLYAAGQELYACRKSFYITLGQIGTSLIGLMFRKTFMAAVFAIGESVMAFFIAYYVCNSVCEVMNAIEAPEVAKFGEIVVKINFLCYAVTIFLSLITLVPYVGTVAGVLIAIAQAVAAFTFMLFLKKSYTQLGIQ